MISLRPYRLWIKEVVRLHRFFVSESRSYIGPYTWRTRLLWPRAWVRFMWLSLFT